MTSLVRPDVALHVSWAAAMNELRVEGEHVNGSGLWMLPEAEQWDLSEAGCARLVAVLLAAVDLPPVTPTDGSAAPGSAQVPCHFLWITEGDDVVGCLALRTSLNAWLLEQGGHIGYCVVPSRRRSGHAHRALNLAVRRAGDLGLDRVLVTCEVTNVGSARTIESAGGVLEDVRQHKRRYWVDTAAPPPR